MPLETDRLLLRPISEADADAWAEFFADAEARKWLHSPGSDTRPAATAALQRWAAMFDDPVGMYAVVVRETGDVAGWVGFVPRRLDWGDEIELGWMLRRAFHGRGYATEAARALRPLVPGRVVSMIRVENEPSQNVARKLGMRVERECDYAGFATKVFASEHPAATDVTLPSR
jgi:RimJ/RimL family protein N-acetyltransferase